MKKLITMIIVLGMSAILWGEEGRKDSPWTLEIGSGGALFLDAPVVSLDGQLSYEFLPWLEIGIEASAFHTLEREFQDSSSRSFQSETGMGALFLRAGWNVGNKFNLGLKLSSGTQKIIFRYTGEYRENMVWTEEILDNLDLPVLSGSFSLRYNLCPLHSIQLEGGYRSLHPTGSPAIPGKEISDGFFGRIMYGFKI